MLGKTVVMIFEATKTKQNSKKQCKKVNVRSLKSCPCLQQPEGCISPLRCIKAWTHYSPFHLNIPAHKTADTDHSRPYSSHKFVKVFFFSQWHKDEWMIVMVLLKPGDDLLRSSAKRCSLCWKVLLLFRVSIFIASFLFTLTGIGPGGGTLVRKRMRMRMLRADWGAAPPVPSAVGGGSGKSPQRTCRSLSWSGRRAEQLGQVGSDLLCFSSKPLRTRMWTRLFLLNIDPGEADRSAGWNSAVYDHPAGNRLSQTASLQMDVAECSDKKRLSKSKNEKINVSKYKGKTLMQFQ